MNFAWNSENFDTKHIYVHQLYRAAQSMYYILQAGIEMEKLKDL